MKKIFYVLITLILSTLLIPIVFAANEVSIESIELIEQSDNTVELSKPTTKGLDISFDLSFVEIEDYAKYKVIIDNPTNKDYEIQKENNFKDSDHLKYEFEFDSEGNIVKPNSKLTMFIIITYNKKIELDEYKDGIYEENNAMAISLATESQDSPINPETKDALIKIALTLLILSIATFLLLTTKRKSYMNITLLFLLLVPIIVHAIEKLQINITTKVTIEEKRHIIETRYLNEKPDLGIPNSVQERDFWQYARYIKTITFETSIKEPEDYVYKFDVSADKNESVLAYLVTNEDFQNNYDLYIMCDGYIYANPDSSFAFDHFVKLDTINNITYYKTPLAENMINMFSYIPSIKVLDLHHFNTENVTSMQYMFAQSCRGSGGCMGSIIESIDVSSFNTSNVTDMSYMFSNCYYLEELNVSSFDTSKVTTMSGMFSSLFTLEELDVSNYNTSNVIDMSYMFSGVKADNLDLRNFDTSNVFNMEGMFRGSGVKNLNISSFDTSNVTNMSSMFSSCSNLENLDVSNFDTSNVSDMSSMFAYLLSLTTIDLSNFDTSKVTTMSGMFSGSENLTNLDLTSFDTSNVVYMSYMFNGCDNLSNLNISSFDTSNVITMSYMFANMENVTSLNVSSLNTSNVTTMRSMFGGSKSLITLDLSNFDTSNVTDMSRMFEKSESLISINLSSFDTSNVTDMSRMFEKCESLISINLSSFDTTKVKYMGNMFQECRNLISLDLSNFHTPELTEVRYMFKECNSLVSLNISNLDTSKINYLDEMFYNCNSLTSLDISNFNTRRVTHITYTFYNDYNLEEILVSENWDIRTATSSDQIFYNCIKLRNFDPNYIDKTRAHTGEDGYLTLKV